MDIIVTRPSLQAAPLIAALTQLGHRVEAMPLMQIEPLPDDSSTGALRQLIQNIDQYCAVVVVSMNAADAGLTWLDAYWPEPPIGIDWVAVGPSTAERLTKAGLPVHCPESGFDSEAMLALPCLQAECIAGKKVLLWRGVGGREKLATTLRERGALVDYTELYRRLPIHYSAARWQQALQSRPVLLLSSTEQIEIVLAQYPQSRTALSALITPSVRSALLAKEQGFAPVIAAASARDEDSLLALSTLPQSIEKDKNRE